MSFFFSIAQNSFAVNDVVRHTGVDDDGFCKTQELRFDPVAITDSDLLWELDNPVCIAYMATTGLSLMRAHTAASNLCYRASSAIKSVRESAVKAGKEISKPNFFWSIIEMSSNAGSCASHSTSCILSVGSNTFSCSAMLGCCGGTVALGISYGLAIGALNGVWRAAVGSQENAKICGSRWNTWEEFNAITGHPVDQESTSNAKRISRFGANDSFEYTDKETGETKYWQDHLGEVKDKTFYKQGKNSKSYSKYLEELYVSSSKMEDYRDRISILKSLSDPTTYPAQTAQYPLVSMKADDDDDQTNDDDFTLRKKEYREFIYGGMEYPDSGAGSCKNPSSWLQDPEDGEGSLTKAERNLGYNDENQKYYMRGPNKASNYACGRFLLIEEESDREEIGEKSDWEEAYDCCVTRSQETMCIEDSRGLLFSGTHGFCKKGRDCSLSGIVYNIYESKNVSNRLCASTYSVCPYNHNLGGGSEDPGTVENPLGVQYDNKFGISLNHCQYLNHCSVIPDKPYIRTNKLDGGWISSACFDLQGDSQNKYSYSADLLPLNKTKNFSAPMAQCFKETMENMFLNKAGNTKCTNPDESPDADGNCDGGYIYKEGEFIDGQVSFFQIIQTKLQSIIKVVMTLAVVMLGIKILLTGEALERKVISMFIIKLGLVSYFALGTAWQDYFFKGVSSISADLSTIFMKVDENYNVVTYDSTNFKEEFRDDVRNLFFAITKENITRDLTTDEANFESVFNGCRSSSLTWSQSTFCLNDLRSFLITKGSNGAPNMNEINLGETDAKILNININRAITELRTTNMTPFSFSESYLSDANHQYLDGCQFPKYNYADKNPDTTYDNPSYPPGKEYLKIWDMLDCKIARALGFGPEVSVPNLVIMILAGILTGGLGIIFFIATFVFAFYLIALTVRALHIFIMSSIAISILIYISPLTISACLFEKTKDIFNGWKENLISFVFQPIILFVYLGLVIVIFEKVVIGDAQFIGSGRDSPKSISCSVGNAANNSIYCIFGFNLMRNIEGDGLDFLGIYLGSLFGMTEEKMFTIIKAAFLMYILTKFLDQIPDFAQRLLGGMALSSSSVGAGRALYKSYGASRAVQSRGSRGTRKWVPKIIGKVGRSNSSSLQNNLTGKTSKKTGPEDRPPPKPTTGAG